MSPAITLLWETWKSGCPKLDHLPTWQTAYEQARGEGDELWYYTVGIYQGGSLLNKTVDVPLIETRLMHWLNYRYDLRGYLHWGFNAWTDDPVNAEGTVFIAVISAASRSWACRRDSRRTTSMAVLRVTWYSHAESTVPGLSLCALRASSIKTDWETSSANWGERTCRNAAEYTRFTWR